jgi:hypothetical protein
MASPVTYRDHCCCHDVKNYVDSFVCVFSEARHHRIWRLTSESLDIEETLFDAFCRTDAHCHLFLEY